MSQTKSHQRKAIEEAFPHDNITIVVFGASGDLSRKKTFPALYGLYRNEFLPSTVHIIGFARSKMERAEFHKRISEKFVTFNDGDLSIRERFLSHCYYYVGEYNDPRSYQGLHELMNELEKGHAPDAYKKSRLFYLATPPTAYMDIARGLKENVYFEDAKTRLVIEKPFGMNLESSRELSKNLTALFKEEQIYRIDHFLGKEMVKNLLTLRFANIFFGAIWNCNNIDNVQVTLKEPFGAEGRGGYFDKYGIIRDVMQNHIIQIVSLIAMEKPRSLSSEDIRNAKVEVLKHIDPITEEDLLIGQYCESQDGTKKGYREDDTVPGNSNTPTYAVAVVYVQNGRWSGVPFILKAGKALDELKTEIRVQFRDVSETLFEDIDRNELVIRVQPKEAVYMKMMNKRPGLGFKPIISELDLTYHRRYSDLRIPDAYESLILDVLQDDHSNFVRDDELDAAWRIFTPVLHLIDQKKIISKPYPYGSRGPEDADTFVQRHGFRRHSKEYIWSPEPVSVDRL